jgi:hypothetical protein
VIVVWLWSRGVVVMVVDALRSGRVVLSLEPGGLDGVGRRNQAASDVPRGLRSYRTGSLKLDFPDMDA